MNAARHPDRNDDDHDDADSADPATTHHYETADGVETLVVYERGNPRAWIQSSVWVTLGG